MNICIIYRLEDKLDHQAAPSIKISKAMLNEAAAPRASKQIKQIYILFVTDKKKTKCIRFIDIENIKLIAARI